MKPSNSRRLFPLLMSLLTAAILYIPYFYAVIVKRWPIQWIIAGAILFTLILLALLDGAKRIYER